MAGLPEPFGRERTGLKVLDEIDLRRVAIAISAFRSDAAVLALLKKIFDGSGTGTLGFAAVIVVDSLSDGSLQRDIMSTGWPVHYENSPTNLGSAGNLARRLALASDRDADWCFAINGDGMFDRDLIARLVACAASASDVGAVYPARVWTSRGGTVPVPHTSFFRAPRHRVAALPDQAMVEVAWDSSNGALYGLAPVRAGTSPLVDLWHGWEDLAYGWQLRHDGWKQFLCPGAIYRDDYEYESVKLFGRRFFIAEKPPWLAYYLIRNAIMIVLRARAGMAGWLFVANRLIREVAFTLLFRRRKTERLRMIALGFRDGLAQKTGKHPRIP